MSTVWNKIDPGLATIYADHLGEGESGADRRVSVSLHFTGRLEELEELGFECRWREDDRRAKGSVDLAHLERLAAHPGVKRIVSGRKKRLTLDESVPNIKANLVWTLTGGAFSGETGAKAAVGIIDSGIDFHHPFFLESTSPPTTRIKRIWDPGLVPDAGRGERSPDPALLSGGPDTYGVEYTDAQINAVLRGGATKVDHRDCGGHGTHVASIAAGDGRPAFKFVGVAPRADIVVVKHFDLKTAPTIGSPPVPVNASTLFRDAVSYIRNVVREPDIAKPVAINCSFGNSLGPHDGFTDDEDWLTANFKTAAGAVLVQAAGNDGGFRQHARIEFPPAGGTVQIPLELYDGRTNRKSHDSCKWKLATEEAEVDIYYPSGGSTLSAELDIPGDGKGFIAGPPLAGTLVGGVPSSGMLDGQFGGWTFRMIHSEETTALLAGGTVTRSNLFFRIKPFMNRHRLGRYKLKLTASGKLTVHLWCWQSDYGFKIGTVPVNFVFVEDRNLIGDNAGAANIITVAGYDAHPRASVPIMDMSSRGPLVSYGPGPAQPAKPDIAAPGLAVDAAKSQDRLPTWPGKTFPLNGTSMSAPHVTGAVALMLSKNPALTAADAARNLRASARTAPPTTPEEAGAGRLDAKAAVDHP